MSPTIYSVNYNFIPSNSLNYKKKKQSERQTALCYLYLLCKHRQKCLNKLVKCVTEYCLTDIYGIFGVYDLIEDRYPNLTMATVNSFMENKDCYTKKIHNQILNEVITFQGGEVLNPNKPPCAKELWRLIGPNEKLTAEKIKMFLYVYYGNRDREMLTDMIEIQSKSLLRVDISYDYCSITKYDYCDNLSAIPNTHVGYMGSENIKVIFNIDKYITGIDEKADEECIKCITDNDYKDYFYECIDESIDYYTQAVVNHLKKLYKIESDDYSISYNINCPYKMRIVFNEIFMPASEQGNRINSECLAIDKTIYRDKLNLFRLPECRKIFNEVHKIVKGKMDDFIHIHAPVQQCKTKIIRMPDLIAVKCSNPIVDGGEWCSSHGNICKVKLGNKRCTNDALLEYDYEVCRLHADKRCP